uniref:Uncharacterized protein n=1 Tax=Tetranychus urticae TaxID=32264 RepID=T1KED4_TETUR
MIWKQEYKGGGRAFTKHFKIVQLMSLNSLFRAFAYEDNTKVNHRLESTVLLIL